MLQVDEAVIGSHQANAGYGGQGSLSLLFMQWLIEPIFQVIRCEAAESAAFAREGITCTLYANERNVLMDC